MEARPSGSEPIQPGRSILRLAGLFTQIACAGCLLLGTIAFVMLQQAKAGGTPWVIGWAGVAMTGLVFGGLMVRGGLIAVLASALIDIGFGSILLVIDKATLGTVLKVLSADDVGLVSDALFGSSIALIVIGLLCFASIPQALRYNRWLHAGESGDFARASSDSLGDSLAAQVEAIEEPPRPFGQRTTNRGFPPPPLPASKSSMWLAPAAPPIERRSRRRMYFALGGFAIGFGAGIGVLVSSTTRKTAVAEVDPGTATGPGSGSGSGSAKPTTPDNPDTPRTPDKPGGFGAQSNDVKPGSGSGSGAGSGSSSTPTKPATTVQRLLLDQHTAIAHGDLGALSATLAPAIVGFGIDGDEVGEGRAAIEAQVKRDLAEYGDGGITVASKYTHVGQEAGCAWVAEDLELSGKGNPARRIAITQLACPVGGVWQTIGWQWAAQVPDSSAERMALLGTKPPVKAINSKVDGPKALDAAVRAAFASKSALVDARSERADAFNFGSGPNERSVGGTKIKSVFGSLRADIKLHDGVRAVAANSTVACALVNADFTAKTRAQTDLTLTFRVFVVLVQEGTSWNVVLTQWSHGGPIR